MALRFMTAQSLGAVARLFLEAELSQETRLPNSRFKLDHCNLPLNVAYEYDGPEHYCEVGHIERDIRKNESCAAAGIILKRWPYYFQLTRDLAKHFFGSFYTDAKYIEGIRLVYDTTDERKVLAPGLHDSKNTPANFVRRGADRFFKEIDESPASLTCQVVRSFQIYLGRLGPDRRWLLLPEHDQRFDDLMKHQPRPEHLNCLFPFADAAGEA